jgi:hypothetical protein
MGTAGVTYDEDWEEEDIGPKTKVESIDWNRLLISFHQFAATGVVTRLRNFCHQCNGVVFGLFYGVI